MKILWILIITCGSLSGSYEARFETHASRELAERSATEYVCGKYEPMTTEIWEVSKSSPMNVFVLENYSNSRRRWILRPYKNQAKESDD